MKTSTNKEWHRWVAVGFLLRRVRNAHAVTTAGEEAGPAILTAVAAELPTPAPLPAKARADSVYAFDPSSIAAGRFLQTLSWGKRGGAVAPQLLEWMDEERRTGAGLDGPLTIRHFLSTQIPWQERGGKVTPPKARVGGAPGLPERASFAAAAITSALRTAQRHAKRGESADARDLESALALASPARPSASNSVGNFLNGISWGARKPLDH